MRNSLLSAAALTLALPIAAAMPAASAAPAAPAGGIAGDGRIAYVVSDCCGAEIWVVNPDGTDARNITNTPDALEYDPSWSPDGTKIVYTRFDDEFDFESDIWVMDADGSNQTRLTTSTDPEFQADWSPDGSQLVYAAYTEGEVITSQADLFVMNADGSNPTNVTAGQDTDEIDPAWSPDGDRIVFAGVRVAPEGGGYWEIVTMDPDGSNQTPLTVAHEPGYEDRYPNWSPDGEMIVWMAQENEPCCGTWDVWAMNEDGSGQTNLTGDVPGTDWFPSWSPDGQWIIFTSYRDSQFGDVYAMPAPTELPPPAAAARAAAAPAGWSDGAVRITNGGNASQAAWGPEQTAPLTLVKTGDGRGSVLSTDGSIACPDTCRADYAPGTRIRLKARPKPGSVFAGWGGACSGTIPSCTVTIEEATTVHARFKATTTT